MTFLKIFTLFCNIVFLLISTTVAQQANYKLEKAPPEVLQVAKDAWDGQYLEITSLKPASFGFERGDTVRKASLGEPFKMFIITGKGLFDKTPVITIKSIIQLENIWNVPIMLNGEIRAIITVRSENNHWTFYQFGMANAATAMRKINKQWPQNKGYHPVFISTFNKFYFSVPEIDSINLTPVFKYRSETSMSDTANKTTSSTSVISEDDYSKLEKLQDHVATIQQQIYGMKREKRPDLKIKGRN